MKTIKVTPAILKGEINIPPSKSLSHRSIISAALAEGFSSITNTILSDDIIATCKAMEAFGAKIDRQQEGNSDKFKLFIKGNIGLKNNYIDCFESGSTLRFLIPLALLGHGKVTFDGRGKLVTRPLNPYYRIFDKQNIKYTLSDGQLPLTVDGKLKSGNYQIRGDVSSQFVSGLMFVLPLINGDSSITITTKLESKGYVDLTLDMLGQYGIQIKNKDYKEFIIKGNQKYKACDYKVEGDFSQAAFWITAGILGGNIKCCDLNINSLQGDKAILEIVKKMGADIQIKDDCINVYRSQTNGIVIDASQCPDLVPILAVLGALSNGTTKIINAARLRIKESDRLKAISTELKKLGADINELDDGLVINGVQSLRGGMVDSWNDHRIAMALAIASIRCSEPVIITSSDAVKKSYPMFWSDFVKLGGKINEQHMG